MAKRKYIHEESWFRRKYEQYQIDYIGKQFIAAKKGRQFRQSMLDYETFKESWKATSKAFAEEGIARDVLSTMIKEQQYYISPKQAKAYTKFAKEIGLSNIKYGDLLYGVGVDEVKDKLSLYYHDLLETGLNSTQARDLITENFFSN